MLRFNKGALLSTILAASCVFGGFDAQCSYINNNNSDEVVLEMGIPVVAASVDHTGNDVANAAAQGSFVGRFAGYCYNIAASAFSWISSSEPVGDSRYGSLAPDLLKKIFYFASERGCDPRELECVNKAWRAAFRHNISAKEGVSYETKKSDFFMEHCMMSFVDAQVSMMELFYWEPKAFNYKEKVPFLANGVADFSKINPYYGVMIAPDRSVSEELGNFAITKNKDGFIEAGGVHLRKYVMLVLPMPRALDMLPPEVIGNCHATDVVIFGRQNNGVTPFLSPVELQFFPTNLGIIYDYHICKLGELFSSDLLSLWSKSKVFASSDVHFMGAGVRTEVEEYVAERLKPFYFRPERRK